MERRHISICMYVHQHLHNTRERLITVVTCFGAGTERVDGTGGGGHISWIHLCFLISEPSDMFAIQNFQKHR